MKKLIVGIVFGVMSVKSIASGIDFTTKTDVSKEKCASRLTQVVVNQKRIAEFNQSLVSSSSKFKITCTWRDSAWRPPLASLPQQQEVPLPSYMRRKS